MNNTIDTRPKLDPDVFDDWKADHRVLPEYGRDQAIRYIDAIVARDPIACGADELAQSLARTLWMRFRTAFDELRGPFSKSDREDVARALARI